MNQGQIPPGGGKHQNLAGFTAQIRGPDTETIVGSAFVVDRPNGLLATCRHVVEDASPDDFGPGAKVWVYFPQIPEGMEKLHRARLVRYLDPHEDDVVIVQLETLPVPSQVGVAILGSAEDSVGCAPVHKFKSFGFRIRDNYQGWPATGEIVDFAPADGKLLRQTIMLDSKHIDSGMSGAAVLDLDRNLVVGIIAEKFTPGPGHFPDRDTRIAVDCSLLGSPPFDLELRGLPLPLQLSALPALEVTLPPAAVIDPFLQHAPTPLPEWVGRHEFLVDLNQDWTNPGCRMTGLIGFGGEGKSSLARRWLDELLSDPTLPRPEGAFWWDFYARPSIDEFFAAAFTFLSGRSPDPEKEKPLAQAHYIAFRLHAGRFLFILDGLEKLQHQEGDRYGLLTSADFREFLGYVAGSGHASFCLLTSRIPLLDLLPYSTYKHHEVERLSPGDGRELLEKLGVHGPDPDLDRLVADWEGHAMTLSLIASYLKDRHGGDISKAGDIPPPTAAELRYDRVHRILRHYDEHLGQPERTFLAIFSAFRLPVPTAAIKPVFRTKKRKDPSALNSPLTRLDDASFQALLQGLIARRLLRFDPQAQHYTVHPLIRTHYLGHFRAGPLTQVKKIHRQIKDFYLSVAAADKPLPTLEDLSLFIEAVHHACCSENYDEGAEIYKKYIDQGDRHVITHRLGAWATELSLMIEFFANGDLAEAPLVSNPRAQAFILNEVGMGLESLGRLQESLPFFERGNDSAISRKDWESASNGYQNLSGLLEHLGELANSAVAATEALAVARRGQHKHRECLSLSYQGWLAHQRGDLQAAAEAFSQAEILERQIAPSKRYLYGLRGIRHADHLRRIGEADYARAVTAANLKICQQEHFPADLSRGRRLLGDLEAEAGRPDQARKHYHEALCLARSISRRDVLIEVLSARGRWLARQGDASAAFLDLEEALSYAVAGGYRIYEANIRIGKAWAHRAASAAIQSRDEAERAKALSADMGYHWGQVDAAEILAKLP